MASTRFFYPDLTQRTPRKATENSESFGQNQNTGLKLEARLFCGSQWSFVPFVLRFSLQLSGNSHLTGSQRLTPKASPFNQLRGAHSKPHPCNKACPSGQLALP